MHNKILLGGAETFHPQRNECTIVDLGGGYCYMLGMGILDILDSRLIKMRSKSYYFGDVLLLLYRVSK